MDRNLPPPYVYPSGCDSGIVLAIKATGWEKGRPGRQVFSSQIPYQRHDSDEPYAVFGFLEVNKKVGMLDPIICCELELSKALTIVQRGCE